MSCNPRAVKRHCRFLVSWWHVSVTATSNPTRRRLRKLVITSIVTSCIVIISPGTYADNQGHPSSHSLMIYSPPAVAAPRRGQTSQEARWRPLMYSIRVVVVFMLMQLLPAGTAYTYTERGASRAVILRIDSSLNLSTTVKTTTLHDSVTLVILLRQTQLSDMHRKVGMP